MKRFLIAPAFIAALLGTSSSAGAQYYEIANQLPSLIRPALSGSLNYKGYVDGAFIKGVGSNQADFIDISTSQGFTYSSWFYMGAGIGVDILFAHTDNNWGNAWDNDNWNGNGFNTDHSSTKTAVMIPVFTDFRFNIGKPQSTSFYIDIRLGASFLVGNDYIRINNGYLTDNECFYLRPSIGVRIPTNKNNLKQAVNVGLDYQLITSSYWSGYSNSCTLNGLGLNISYEW